MKLDIIAICSGLALLLTTSTALAREAGGEQLAMATPRTDRPMHRAAGQGHDHKHDHGDEATRFGPLTIAHVQVRASIGNAPNSAAYLHVMTEGPADRLIAASVPVARRVELHTVIRDGASMKMQQIDGVDVTADAPARLDPGGNHIMIMGLTERLREGDMVELTLTFEKAGTVSIMAPIRRIKRTHTH